MANGCSPYQSRMPTGTTPRARRASWSAKPTVTTRSGCSGIVVSPYLCSIVTGNPPSPAGVDPDLLEEASRTPPWLCASPTSTDSVPASSSSEPQAARRSALVTSAMVESVGVASAHHGRWKVDLTSREKLPSHHHDGAARRRPPRRRRRATGSPAPPRRAGAEPASPWSPSACSAGRRRQADPPLLGDRRRLRLRPDQRRPSHRARSCACRAPSSGCWSAPRSGRPAPSCRASRATRSPTRASSASTPVPRCSSSSASTRSA